MGLRGIRGHVGLSWKLWLRNSSVENPAKPRKILEELDDEVFRIRSLADEDIAEGYNTVAIGPHPEYLKSQLRVLQRVVVEMRNCVGLYDRWQSWAQSINCTDSPTD